LTIFVSILLFVCEFIGAGITLKAVLRIFCVSSYMCVSLSV